LSLLRQGGGCQQSELYVTFHVTFFKGRGGVVSGETTNGTHFAVFFRFSLRLN